jgi:hypothetical protein
MVIQENFPVAQSISYMHTRIHTGLEVATVLCSPEPNEALSTVTLLPEASSLHALLVVKPIATVATRELLSA